MRKKITLCGQPIQVDHKNTNRNLRILKKIEKLLEKYNISILIGDKVLELYDAKIYSDELYIEINGVKTYFYDTLDDENNPYLFFDSDNRMKTFRYKVDKIGYMGQKLYYKEMLEIDREYDIDDELPYYYDPFNI